MVIFIQAKIGAVRLALARGNVTQAVIAGPEWNKVIVQVSGPDCSIDDVEARRRCCIQSPRPVSLGDAWFEGPCMPRHLHYARPD